MILYYSHIKSIIYMYRGTQIMGFSTTLILQCHVLEDDLMLCSLAKLLRR